MSYNTNRFVCLAGSTTAQGVGPLCPAGSWCEDGAVVETPDTFVLMGGFSSGYENDVWTSSDGASWTQINSAAAWTERGHIEDQAVVLGSNVILVGGHTSGGWSNEVSHTDTPHARTHTHTRTHNL